MVEWKEMSIDIILLIGVFGLCLIIFSVVVYIASKRHAQMDALANINPLMATSDARNDFEKIQWLTDLLLKQEFGKLKIGQIELIDEIRKFAEHGAGQMRGLVQESKTPRNVGKAMFPLPKAPAAKKEERKRQKDEGKR